METEFDRTKLIVWACWGFFGACALVEGRWLILRLVCALDWGAPDWAAWVQAVGSVVAIAGAFRIANRQHANERALELERRHADERQRFKIVKVLLAKTYATNDLIRQEINSSSFFLPPDHRVPHLRECQKALNAIQPFDLPHEDLFLYCSGACQAIDLLCAALTDRQLSVFSAERSGATSADDIEDGLKVVASLSRDGIALCDTEISARTT